MSSTGLQKYIDIDLDATKSYLVDVSVYTPKPEGGIINTSVLMTPSVESLLETAREKFESTDRASIIVFKFPSTDQTIECYMDGGELVCRRSPIFQV